MNAFFQINDLQVVQRIYTERQFAAPFQIGAKLQVTK